MSREIIQKVGARLKSMYPNYRFDVKCTQDGCKYMITAFKDSTSIDTYTAQSNTPITTFWDNVKAWMKTVMTKSH